MEKRINKAKDNININKIYNIDLIFLIIFKLIYFNNIKL